MRRFSFISGKENSESLKVDYEIVENEVRAKFTPHWHHTSYENTVHGGLLAALLDDAMAWAINRTGVVAYTGKFELRYRKPPQAEQELVIRAWIDDQKMALYYTRGIIETLQGEKLVEAKAVFMDPSAL